MTTNLMTTKIELEKKIAKKRYELDLLEIEKKYLEVPKKI